MERLLAAQDDANLVLVAEAKGKLVRKEVVLELVGGPHCGLNNDDWAARLAPTFRCYPGHHCILFLLEACPSPASPPTPPVTRRLASWLLPARWTCHCCSAPSTCTPTTACCGPRCTMCRRHTPA